MTDASARARQDTPSPAETLRLTFRFEGDRVELVSRQRVRMIAPPSIGDPPEGGRSSGAWIELQDRQGRTVAYRVLHDPFQTHAEHHSPDGRIERVERPVESGEFEVLLPAVPEGTAVSLWSSPVEPRLAGEPATEIARFDLTDDTNGGKEVAS
jgi:hypothetical protein